MFLISDNIDTLTGMRLAGVDGTIAHTKEELKYQLDIAIEDEEIGILLVMEKLANQFPEIIDDIRLKRSLPLVVMIPDRHGTGRSSDFITSYLREAIGIKLS